MDTEETKIKLSKLHKLEALILQKMPEWSRIISLYGSTTCDTNEELLVLDEFEEIDIIIRKLQQEYHDICSDLGLIDD
jgi:hypothetical protein